MMDLRLFWHTVKQVVTVNSQLNAAARITILTVIDAAVFDCSAYFNNRQEYRTFMYNE